MLVASLSVFGSVTLLAVLANGSVSLTVARFFAGIGMGGAMPNAIALDAIALVFRVAENRWRTFALAMSAVFVPVGGVVAVEPVSKGQQMRSAGVFSRELLGSTLALCLAAFACMVGLYCLVNWLPSLFSELGMGTRQSSLALTAHNVGGIISASVAGIIAGRFGPRIPLVTMFVAGAVVALLLALSPDSYEQQFGFTLFALGLFGVATTGAQTVLYAFAAETYGEHNRATGVGFAVGCGRLGGIASAFVGAELLSFPSPESIFFGLEVLTLLLLQARSCSSVPIPVEQRHKSTLMLASNMLACQL